MKFLFLVLMISSSVFGFSTYKAEFPMGPNTEITPAALCDRPDAYRYAEQIPYCNRDVDSSLKAEIFQEYRENGYRLNPKERSSYKIDHSFLSVQVEAMSKKTYGLSIERFTNKPIP